jgi:hypothetical protein
MDRGAHRRRRRQKSGSRALWRHRDTEALQAEYYFDSLEKALAALKKDKRLARVWRRRKIITTLLRLHRAKRDLTYSEARRTFQPLVSAAEAYFGSWGTALRGAGIDPNVYFVYHTWRKSMV